MNVRDKTILEHIIRYCDEVEETVRQFGGEKDTFEENFIFRNAVSMPIMQIGELATRLSESFLTETTDIPWKAIKGMRTFFAHQYGSMSIGLIWTTAVERIPELRQKCQYLLDGDKQAPDQCGIKDSFP